MSLRLPGEGPEAAICSRAGCAEDAAWNVNWRNPKIHGAERVKIWLACDAHREYLSEYLAARDFPVVVTPLPEHVERLPDPIANPASLRGHS
jgi:hypothetical protein